MIVRFDSFHRAEMPQPILCMPNGNHVAIINNIKDFHPVFNFNDISELTITASKFSDEKVECPAYDKIKKRKKILINEYGYFIIDNVNEEMVGTPLATKTLTAKSCEFELAFIELPYIEGTYSFPELMEEIMPSLPRWTLSGSIPSAISEKYRTFEDVGVVSVYDFLKSSVQDAYGCIFQFDIKNRVIIVYDKSNFANQTSIVIDNEDVVNNIKINENTDDMFTAVTATGGNDLDVSYVNPLGGNTIYNFSYYKTSEWMSQSLITAVTNWENKVNLNESAYSDLIVELIEKYQEKIIKQSQLTGSGNNLKLYEQQKAAIMAEGGNLETINGNIAVETATYNSLLDDIDDIQSEIDDLEDDKAAINNDLKLTNPANFTSAQYKDLCDLISCCEYKNENITVTETMTEIAYINQSLELYNDAKEQLAKISEPNYEYAVDTESFIFSEDFEPYTEQLETGCLINIRFSDDDVAQLALHSMSVDFINGTVEFKFGNRYKLSNQIALWEDMQNKVTSVSHTVQKMKDKWSYPTKPNPNTGSSAIKDLQVYMNSALRLVNNKIISEDGQSIEIRDDGLYIRKLVGGIPIPQQIAITNGTIVCLDEDGNGKQIAKLALGNIELPNGSTEYGLIAEAIYGNLLAGNKLIIQSEDGTCTIDASGITVYRGGIKIYSQEQSDVTEFTVPAFEANERGCAILGDFTTIMPPTGSGVDIAAKITSKIESGVYKTGYFVEQSNNDFMFIGNKYKQGEYSLNAIETQGGMEWIVGGDLDITATALSYNGREMYEEGTFAVGLRGASVAGVFALNSPSSKGVYYRIGKMCFCSITVSGSRTSGGSGQLSLTGLPYARDTSFPYSASIGNMYGGSSDDVLSYVRVAYNLGNTFRFKRTIAGDNQLYDLNVTDLAVSTPFVINFNFAYRIV